MAFHVSNYGLFGRYLPHDINGFVPTEDTGPFDLTFPHEEGEQLHDSKGKLTEYGQWWVEEEWPEIKKTAIEATQDARRNLTKWRESGQVQ